MWKESRLPDPVSWSLKWNGIIHTDQRVRLPNDVKANRETCKSVVIMSAPVYGNTISKASRYTSENGMTDVFFKEHSGG